MTNYGDPISNLVMGARDLNWFLVTDSGTNTFTYDDDTLIRFILYDTEDILLVMEGAEDDVEVETTYEHPWMRPGFTND